MPRKYKRKPGVNPRQRKWSKNDLEAALVDLDRNVMGINHISRLYNIPARTLRRRQKTRNKDIGSLGKKPILGFENEKRLVKHIQKLENSGFPPDREAIRMLAYQLAEKLRLTHTFNHDTQMAGYQWLQSFLERNDELSIRVAEVLSMARAQGLNKEELGRFYDLLLNVLTENDLLDKPERIYNMDETGIQLNNKPGKVLATKGSRSVKMVTSGEKGETMTLVGCCNAVGNYLPPVMIIKGVNKKPEFIEGLPHGSKVYMNKKSAYINTDLFRKWLTEHFIANKPDGKVVLLLDGHTSHSSAIDMLEEAEKHEVILLCLPSHTTSVLQPLDRAVYKPFKTFFNQETNQFMRTNPQKKISRTNVARLIGRAWLRAATPLNAIAGFRGSGIFPFDPNAIPDYEFNIADKSLTQEHREAELPLEAGLSNDNERDSPNLIRGLSQLDEESNNSVSPTIIRGDVLSNEVDEDKTDCEGDQFETQVKQMRVGNSATPKKSNDIQPPIHKIPQKTAEDYTPSKFLAEVAPVPTIPTPFLKRGKQSAEVLNSRSKIEEMKESKGKKTKGIPLKKSRKGEGKENNAENDFKNRDQKMKGQVSKKNSSGRQSTGKRNQPKSKKIERIYSSSEEEENHQLNAQLKKKESFIRQGTETKRHLKRKKIARIYSSSEDEANDDICCVCFEDYFLTTSKADWIQCTVCKKWLHDTCTVFKNSCKTCGVSSIVI